MAAYVEVPQELVREARGCHWLRTRVRYSDPRREPIICDGQVVGFYTPHHMGGVLRLGPMYITPAFRGRGLMATVYASITETVVALVEDGNAESERLHLRCGFVRWRRRRTGWWYRREEGQDSTARQVASEGSAPTSPRC